MFFLLFRSTSSDDDDIIVARFQDDCITGYPQRQKQLNDCCVIVCVLFLLSIKFGGGTNCNTNILQNNSKE